MLHGSDGTGQNRLSSFQIGYQAISYQFKYIQLIKRFHSARVRSMSVQFIDKNGAIPKRKKSDRIKFGEAVAEGRGQ